MTYEMPQRNSSSQASKQRARLDSRVPDTRPFLETFHRLQALKQATLKPKIKRHQQGKRHETRKFPELRSRAKLQLKSQGKPRYPSLASSSVDRNNKEKVTKISNQPALPAKKELDLIRSLSQVIQ